MNMFFFLVTVHSVKLTVCTARKASKKEALVLQPSMFRCYGSFMEGMILLNLNRQRQ